MEAYMLSQLLSGNFTIQTIIAEILAVLVITTSGLTRKPPTCSAIRA